MSDPTPAGNRQYNINVILGILGIFTLGVFLDWYPKVILGLPLPKDTVLSSAVSAVWQAGATIVIPCLWAMRRLGLGLRDFGLTTHRLGITLLYGCVLYSLALAAFIHCSADPLISNHAVRWAPLSEAIQLTAVMGLIAAITDITTRGFLLLTLSRYGPVWFAVVIQNLTWYLGHIHEINLLTGCLGYANALGLTLTLGILGDVIALKTRNVTGLAIAHILLNVVLMIYIRQL
ncbi:CPBP family glutamic-type intramembrane protease [Thiohalobacter thiocyanaticus]|uniref:CPBP family intramembrane metalloprotease n=1 Tax=Thiohalobacter thiocyanaticus TaxID=585455 RepID=A0A426QI76_9GAMM|nr:CPBP family glutamic-type intramembrane protease [Thiohalobacter thiocyanaticus]RRQ21447.1 CPBP family intramembrane metalloprotease [Thiohalobacter thiocyanaticus]